MSTTLYVLASPPGGVPEAVCAVHGPEHRVHDLARALAGHLGEPDRLLLAVAGGALLDPSLAIAEAPIRHGDHLLLLRDPAEAPAVPPPVAMELRVLSGAAAGLRLPLRDGRHSLGRGADCELRVPDPTISRSPAWLAVEGRAVVVDAVEARQDMRVGGAPLAPPHPLPAGQVFEMGAALMQVAEPAPPRPAGRGGWLAIRRSPRALPGAEVRTLALPPAPGPPPPVPGLTARLDAGRAAAYRRQVERALAGLPALLDEERRALRLRAPDAADLADRARLGLPSLWERARHDPDFLRLGVGRADQPSAIRIERPLGGDERLADETLHAVLPLAPVQAAAPLTVDLAAHRVLAVTGDEDDTAGLVRWLITQAACLHAPGELEIAAAMGGVAGWDWLAWLPHAAPGGLDSAARLLAGGPAAAGLVAALAQRVEEGADGRALLAVVDGTVPGAGRLAERVLAAPDARVFLVLVGPRDQPAAPASASVVPARNELRLTVGGAALTGVPDQVGVEYAAAVARDLAGVVDGRPPLAAPGLREVLGAEAAGGLGNRWSADAGHLDAALGAGVEVDLLAGPHALVTGGGPAARAGVVRSWVTALALRHSPRSLNVVLLDPTGAAAWDDLRRLPHAVAPPGSIDGTLGALLDEAERRARELAAAGETDLRRLRRLQPESAGANLLVVVDAADHLAAAETRLSRLAEAGPGAGIHLLLSAAAADAVPPPVRRQAGIRVELGGSGRSEQTVMGDLPARAGAAAPGIATVTIARGISTEFPAADPGHLSVGGDGGVRVLPLRFGREAVRDGDAAVLAEAARALAAATPAPVWRPDPAAPPTAPAVPAADGQGATRATVELRLTIESPPQPPRDVAVELALDRTFAELVAALTAQLELGPTGAAGVYQRRTRLWLRPEQSVRSARLRTGDRLLVAPRGFRIEEAPAPAGGPADVDGRVDDRGSIAVNRPPRPNPAALVPRVDLAAPPERGQGGWRSLVPVGTGVLMGLMLGGTTYFVSGSGRSPAILLLSAGMTPLMAVLTGILPAQEALRRRSTFRRASRQWRERVDGLGSEIEAAQALESARLHEAAPDLATLLDRVRRLDPTLWERRPGRPDWLRLRLGLEDTASATVVTFAAGGEPRLRALADPKIEGRPPLRGVPMVLPLAEAGSVGLYGERAAAASAARALVAQAAMLHSPEELVLAAAVPPGEQRRWAWMAWLPHARSRAAVLPGARVVSGPAGAGGLLQRLLALVEQRARRGGTPDDEARTAVLAVLHEDVGLPRGDVARLLERGPRQGVHVIWMAGRRQDLPGECGAELGLEPASGGVRPVLSLVAAGVARTGTTADGASVEDCDEVARALAPLSDLSARGTRATIPENVDLLDLLRVREDLDAGLRRRWARSADGDRPLAVPIGAGPGGGEVVVDLTADTPHLLVEGGAGSGKSELLRSVVAALAVSHPPSSLALLFVDQEGQGTFRECADLPHATGDVLAYLDGAGARRVLAALRMEARRREGALREAGAKDLPALERARPDSAPPHLAILVDEFAGLAADQPELMDGLAALAPQGERLGIHLVLATGRPGSVSRAIRESVGLRVQLGAAPDEGDAAGAAELPPGRGVLRQGAETETELQAAFAGGSRPARRDPGEIVVRELGFGGVPAPARVPAGGGEAAEESDLALIVRAAARLGAGPAAAPAREVLPELSEDAGADEGRATSVPLAELLGIPDVAALNVEELWRPRPLADRLRVPTGLTGRGTPMVMDLKEAAAGGAGPHGLIIGTSGSGKSEMLRTLVTSLAIMHPPEILAFVFIDFKGGAAFAGLSQLPHVAGMITNLQDDLSLIDRMQLAITGERNRRQELLRRAGNVDKLSEYQRKRESGDPLEPLPYLMLIVDEFGELLTARPDFINLFAMVGRVGRSLGIHLLFSSQQFEEGRLRGLEDNLGYRIALRTASPLASRTVLGVPDAFELPKEPGWGYYKYGPTDMTRFRAALVSQPYGPPEAGGETPTTLDVVVAQLVRHGEPVHQIWLPPLEVGITLDRLVGEISEAPGRGLAASGWAGTGQLRVPAGLVDRPAEQKQDVLVVDLTGHLLVVGAAQTGKSTTLRTLISGAALTHTPSEAQFYCVDYGGGTLRSLADLPHVGGVAGRGDVERVRRTVEEITALVVRREARFQALGLESPQMMRARRAAGELPEEMADVFLVIDNWAGLRQELPELEDPIRDVIAARGSGYGVHLVLSANRWLEVRDALRSAIGGRLELRLTEPSESMVDGRAARSLSESARQYEKRVEELRQLTEASPRFEKLFGRGVATGGLQFQAALPRIDGVPGIIDLQHGAEGLVRAVAVAWSGPAAPPIRVLPRSIRAADLPRRDEPGVPVAISERDLGPVHLDLVGGDPHFLVFGDVESGKTTLLRTFLAGLLTRANPDQAQVLIVDYRRGLSGLVPPEHLLVHCATDAAARESIEQVAASLNRRLPGPDVPPDQQHGRSWWRSQAEVYIVVDDYDLVASSSGGPLQPLYALLPQSRDLAFHLLVTRGSGGAGQGVMEPVLRRLRELRTPGLLLSGEPQEGAILGGVRMTPLPPGRGRLIRRREEPTFVQVATPE
jgi:S-DNA-T family DNA segregation ATPase FtsK/SpoIIIE